MGRVARWAVTMQQPVCDLCGNPSDGYVCRRCSDETAGYLKYVVDLAGEVETNVARLARYATRGGHRAAQLEEEPGPKAAGGLRPTPLPVDLNASARAAHAFNAVTTWARMVEDDRGVRAPGVLRGEHPAAVAAAFLIEQLDWLRHQPQADEAMEQLRAAGATIQRIVDRPPDTEIVGVCDCGTHLYARVGAPTVTCRDCGARWDVQESRDSLRETLRGYLMTAAEAAVLLAFFELTGDRQRSRKTIVMWAQRGQIQARGQVDGGPIYLFGEILDRATRVAQQPAPA